MINTERQCKKAIAYQQNTYVKQSVRDRAETPRPNYLVKIVEAASKPEKKENDEAECTGYELKAGVSANIFLGPAVILRLIDPFKFAG
jgi:hypothetical protein